jgi:hypothetical protein
MFRRGKQPSDPQTTVSRGSSRPTRRVALGVTGGRSRQAERQLCGGDLLHNAVYKIVLLRVPGHVLERKDGQRWLVGKGERRQSLLIRALGNRSVPNPTDAHGSGHIFDALLAHVLEGEIHFVAHLIAAGWRAGRAVVYQLTALTVGALPRGRRRLSRPAQGKPRWGDTGVFKPGDRHGGFRSPAPIKQHPSTMVQVDFCETAGVHPNLTELWHLGCAVM